MRARWTPHLGQCLVPFRLVDDMVWLRASHKEGVAQVLSTYDVRGRYEAPTFGKAQTMEVVCITSGCDLLPRVYLRPYWSNWDIHSPYPMWMVRWLSG